MCERTRYTRQTPYRDRASRHHTEFIGLVNAGTFPARAARGDARETRMATARR